MKFAQKCYITFFYVFICRETKPNFHSTAKDTFAATDKKLSIGDTDSEAANKPQSFSPHGKRATPLSVREPGSPCPPKPFQMTPSPAPSVSPLLKRRKAEARQTCPAARMSIPTILVENEPMETECGPDVRNKVTNAQQKVEKVLQSEMGPGTTDKGKTSMTSADQSQMILHSYLIKCFTFIC